MNFQPLPGKSLWILLVLLCLSDPLEAQRMITVKPAETDDVLTNPGMGFMTFQRFNGDALNEGIGWTEGFPIEYQEFDGNLEKKDQSKVKHWQVDHENPLYIKHFGALIREMGERYDGHPDLHAVDLSIIGAWGTLACGRRSTVG
jgi:hypothetical protein